MSRQQRFEDDSTTYYYFLDPFPPLSCIRVYCSLLRNTRLDLIKYAMRFWIREKPTPKIEEVFHVFSRQDPGDMGIDHLVRISTDAHVQVPWYPVWRARVPWYPVLRQQFSCLCFIWRHFLAPHLWIVTIHKWNHLASWYCFATDML